MDSSTTTEVAFEFLPYFRAYKNGKVERFFGTDIVPPSTNPQAGVSSKDLLIVPKTGISARLFMPANASSSHEQKHPVLLYFHGGAFCFGSPFCSTYHNHITSLVAKANVVVVSVDYRLAPEHPLPLAYEDSWEALKWIFLHCNGCGPEQWLNENIDFDRVFIAGDSAGANIVHNVVMRAGSEDLGGLRLLGACMIHPDFASKYEGPTRAWFFACPTTTGSDDPRVNPGMDPGLSRFGCRRVLVCVAENDGLRMRGWHYYETLGKSGWDGVVEIMETKGEEHVFHLFNPTCENALALLERLASFINQD